METGPIPPGAQIHTVAPFLVRTDRHLWRMEEMGGGLAGPDRGIKGGPIWRSSPVEVGDWS